MNIGKWIQFLFSIFITLGIAFKVFQFLRTLKYGNVIIGVIVFLTILLVIFWIKSVPPFYDDSKAKEVAFTNLPSQLKDKIKKEDVDLILDLKFKYQQKIGMIGDSIDVSLEKSLKSTDPDVNPMMNALNKFVIKEANKKNKKYTNDDVDAVWKAEEVYLEQVGLLSEKKK